MHYRDFLNEKDVELYDFFQKEDYLVNDLRKITGEENAAALKRLVDLIFPKPGQHERRRFSGSDLIVFFIVHRLFNLGLVNKDNIKHVFTSLAKQDIDSDDFIEQAKAVIVSDAVTLAYHCFFEEYPIGKAYFDNSACLIGSFNGENQEWKIVIGWQNVGDAPVIIVGLAKILSDLQGGYSVYPLEVDIDICVGSNTVAVSYTHLRAHET